MARRPLPTGPADWLVLAVTPALLVGMVSCLLFFLLAVFYRGEFNERLHWILFFGVVGMVLIGRINLIEEIARRASLYSGILGLLVVIALIRFVPPPPGWPEVGHYLFCAVLVALGFWATRLLVADCVPQALRMILPPDCAAMSKTAPIGTQKKLVLSKKAARPIPKPIVNSLAVGKKNKTGASPRV